MCLGRRPSEPGRGQSLELSRPSTGNERRRATGSARRSTFEADRKRRRPTSGTVQPGGVADRHVDRARSPLRIFVRGRRAC